MDAGIVSFIISVRQQTLSWMCSIWSTTSCVVALSLSVIRKVPRHEKTPESFRNTETARNHHADGPKQKYQFMPAADVMCPRYVHKHIATTVVWMMCIAPEQTKSEKGALSARITRNTHDILRVRACACVSWPTRRSIVIAVRASNEKSERERKSEREPRRKTRDALCGAVLRLPFVCDAHFVVFVRAYYVCAYYIAYYIASRTQYRPYIIVTPQWGGYILY